MDCYDACCSLCGVPLTRPLPGEHVLSGPDTIPPADVPVSAPRPRFPATPLPPMLATSSPKANTNQQWTNSVRVVDFHSWYGLDGLALRSPLLYAESSEM